MDVQAIDQAQAQATAQAASTVQAGQLLAFPTAAASGQKPPLPHIPDGTLHNALSALVGGGSQVSVQFRVVGQNEIVTVFKNAETGEVITQFPPEAMVLIAQFFNKLAGAVVDRTA
jgi:hypothetical protein